MKETVLSQRIQYYVIEPYRSFSKFENNDERNLENKVRDDLNIELENVDSLKLGVFTVESDEQFFALIRDKFRIHLHNKKELKRKNTKYFYSDKENGEDIRLERWSEKTPTFYTTKERHLLKHYGRPLSSVGVRILERNITIDGDNISVRFYSYSKNRTANNKFFKKTKTAYGFKINLKTGNIMTYEGSGISRIRQNNFKHLLYVIELFFGRTINGVINDYGPQFKAHPINIEGAKIFNDDEFVKSLTRLLLSKFPYNKNIITNSGPDLKQRIYKLVMDAFVSINKIKIPNNFEKLMLEAYPTKYFLKRNDNKLVASVLDRIGIKSKGTIKILHKYPDLDIRKLIILTRYFGYQDVHKYIQNINEDFFTSSSNDKDVNTFGSIYGAIKNRFQYNIKDSEKKCLLKVINEFFDNNDSSYNEKIAYQRDDIVTTRQFNDFNDHLDLLTRIRNYLPEIEMRATNLKDFHNEHLEFSKIDRAIKRGYSIKYIFDDKLIKHIEEPIHRKNDSDEIIETYYPVLLKVDHEYTEEGTHMHHCVASYADKDRSIIISVREGSPIGNERVTCEYDTKDKSCTQEKYFCNARPPERFEFALDKLLVRILEYKGSIKSISKEKVPVVINGVEIERKEENTVAHFLELF